MDAEIIRDFLAGSGSGYGNGNGYGYSSGNGDGNGNGNGNGYSSGNGDGNGNGNGNGYSSGNGDGNGNGNGDGNGNGSGSGYGNGDGNGSGSGYGNGSGRGNGNGNHLKIETYNNHPVYYIDKLPCVIKTIRGSIAAVDVINTSSFSLTPMFVAKHGRLFAHGNTIKEAIAGVRQKWEESRSIQERMEEFRKVFKKGGLYDANLFYNWHSILTGSCKAGKDFWVKEHGIDLTKQMTVREFFKLTKEAYGKEIIQDLMKSY